MRAVILTLLLATTGLLAAEAQAPAPQFTEGNQLLRPKDSCWTCHNEHAAVDNAFLQFYPALREAREKAAAK